LLPASARVMVKSSLLRASNHSFVAKMLPLWHVFVVQRVISFKAPVWMNLGSRSRSLSSLFSMTTCFKASCAGKPSFSHFVFWRAVAEIGSCGQHLYRMDESQLCLSATWCNDGDPLLFGQLCVPFTCHSRPPKMICYRFNPRS